MLQYPEPGIFPDALINKKFCHVKKLSIFAAQNKKMSLNLHIHHHHFTQWVSCDVFM